MKVSYFLCERRSLIGCHIEWRDLLSPRANEVICASFEEMGNGVACSVHQRSTVLSQDRAGKHEFGIVPFVGGVVGRLKLFSDKAERGRVFCSCGGACVRFIDM